MGDQLQGIKQELAEAKRRLSLQRSSEFRTALTGNFDAEGFFKKDRILVMMGWLIAEVEKLRKELNDS